MDHSPFIKKLELPAGLTVPTQLAYGDLGASAMRWSGGAALCGHPFIQNRAQRAQRSFSIPRVVRVPPGHNARRLYWSRPEVERV